MTTLAAKSEPASSADGVRWELDDLYAGPDDPDIGAHRQSALSNAEAFAGDYRSRVGGLDAPALAEAAARLETIEAQGYRPLVYAHLLFSTDTGNPRHGALLQAAREGQTALTERLLFFSLEWQQVPAERAAALLADPALARHRHWLERVREATPYTLGESEERILAVKATRGARPSSACSTN